MNEQSRLFDYPLWDKIIQASAVSIPAYATCFVLIITTLAARNISMTAYISMRVGTILFVSVLNFLVLFNHFQLPAVEVSDDTFRLVTPIYKSRWLNWNEIKSIKKHRFSSRFRRVLMIHVGGLNFFFSVVGFIQAFGGPGFVVNDRMKGYEQLLEIIAEKRPELLVSKLIVSS